MGKAIIRWKDMSYGELGQRIYRSQTVFDKESLPAPLATLPANVTEYIDETVEENSLYYYCISSFNDKTELFSDVFVVDTIFSIGPGSNTFVGGDTRAGFLGEVPASEFITGDELARRIGLTEGTSQNSGIPWLKVTLDDKVLFIPKMTFRHSVSWDAIYQAGAVYGTDDNGKYPTGTPRLQNARITIKGYDFRVRLLKGASTDPCENVAGYGMSATFDSEWDRIFYPLTVERSGYPQNNQDGPDWTNYTDEDLGCAGNGYVSWCQERHSYGTAYRVVRGNLSCSSLHRYTSSSANSSFGWRPVLELIV